MASPPMPRLGKNAENFITMASPPMPRFEKKCGNHEKIFIIFSARIDSENAES
jgi:hypothetical protein